MDEVKNAAAGEVVPAERTADAALMEEMAKVGMLFGRKRTRTNPRMKKGCTARPFRAGDVPSCGRGQLAVRVATGGRHFGKSCVPERAPC